MSGKVGATCSSLELQVAPPAFTDTDEWASMKQFEKLATQAIRIEFPNSTNAIRQVDRLAKKRGPAVRFLAASGQKRRKLSGASAAPGQISIAFGT